MKRRVTEDFASATDLADVMVRDAGLSFREAHHVVGAVVRAAMDAGLAADGITTGMVDDAACDQLGRPLGLDPALVRRSLDPTASVAARTLPGGPAPEAVARSVEAAQARLEANRAALAEKRSPILGVTVFPPTHEDAVAVETVDPARFARAIDHDQSGPDSRCEPLTPIRWASAFEEAAS